MSILNFKNFNSQNRDFVNLSVEDQRYLADIFSINQRRLNSRFCLAPIEVLYGKNIVSNIETPNYDFIFEAYNPDIISSLLFKKKFCSQKQCSTMIVELWKNLKKYQDQINKGKLNHLVNYYALIEYDTEQNHMVRAIIKTSYENGFELAVNPQFEKRLEKIKTYLDKHKFVEDVDKLFLIYPPQNKIE